MTWQTRRFWREEHGAVSVDWTVLSAGVIAVAISAVAIVEAAAVSKGEAVFQEVEVANGN